MVEINKFIQRDKREKCKREEKVQLIKNYESRPSSDKAPSKRIMINSSFKKCFNCLLSFTYTPNCNKVVIEKSKKEKVKQELISM